MYNAADVLLYGTIYIPIYSMWIIVKSEEALQPIDNMIHIVETGFIYRLTLVIPKYKLSEE